MSNLESSNGYYSRKSLIFCEPESIIDVYPADQDVIMRKALMAHLRDIRESMGIQQAKFALRMETTQSAISDLETGRVDPQLSTVQKFAATLGARLTITVEVKSRIHHNRFLAWSDGP